MCNLSTLAALLTVFVFSASPANAQQPENMVAVCGCGKVFTVDGSTLFMTVDGKRYACCSQKCHEVGMQNPRAAVAQWVEAERRLLSGGGKSREQIYKEIESMFGLVPSMFKVVPDESLQMEWELFRQVQFVPGAIPNKYRELIGVAVSAISKCHYCAYFHTEVAKLNGATEAEIEDAVHYAKSSAGWSTYINGLQIDFAQFKKEVDQACAYVRANLASKEQH